MQSNDPRGATYRSRAAPDRRRIDERAGRGQPRRAGPSLVVLGLALWLVGCDRISTPPPVDSQPAPPPFPATTHRGIDGDYGPIGGRWAIDARAYTHRYHTAFDRLSVLTASERVRSRAIRITQPTGWGAPLQAFANLFALVEVELYDRRAHERGVYVRDLTRNLAPRAELRCDTEHPTHRLDAVTDGVIAADLSGPLFMSAHTEVPHWIELRFDEPVHWNQLVLYWPMHRQNGPWHQDVGVVDGLRSARVVVQVLEQGLWRTLSLIEERPGSRHDGAFIESWLGLPFRPESRLAHMEAIERWRDALPRLTSPDVRDDETVIGPAWSVATLEGSPELARLGAEELRVTLGHWLDTRPPPASGVPAAGVPAIVIGLLENAPAAFTAAWAAVGGGDLDGFASTPQSFAVLVGETRIWALGRDARGARYAAARLVQRMETHGTSALARGAEMRRPAVTPRAAAAMSIGEGGPDGLGVSDTYLSLMAHYYLDTLYLFQAAPYLDVTSVVGSSVDRSLAPDAEKLEALRNLIGRAGRQGIDVYWCAAIPGILTPDVIARHPELRLDHPEPAVVCLSTPAGKELVTDTARRIGRELPDLAGLVVLRTELTYGCGGRALCDRCRRTSAPADDPAQRIFEWVEAGVRSGGGCARVVAFDWQGGGVPGVDVGALPGSVDVWIRTDRVVGGTEENDIRDVRPLENLSRTLAAPGSHRVVIEDQLSHPFPFHSSPELPAADLYWERWTRRLEATRTAPAHAASRVGFAAGNGGGFYPTSMQDLMLREILWEPLDDRNTVLRRVAARWYGPEQSDEVRGAWREMGHAVREHAHFGKYLTRLTRIRPPGLATGELTPETSASVALLASDWEAAMDRLRAAASRANESHAVRAREALAMAEGVSTSIASLDHAARWAVRHPGVGSDELERIPPAERAGAIALLDEELDNMHRTIALFGQHAIFRAHPYYRNWFGLPVLAQKVQSLTAMRTSLGAPSR